MEMVKNIETQNQFNEPIQELAKSNPTAEGIFLLLATRERNRFETDLQRLKIQLLNDKIKVVNEDFSNVFKKLQELGIGSVVYGRAGKNDRFKWNYSLIDIGKIAVDPTIVVHKVKHPVLKTIKRTRSKRQGRPVGFKMTSAQKRSWYAARWGKKRKQTKLVRRSPNTQTIKLLKRLLKSLGE